MKQARQLTRGLPLQARPRIQEFEQGLRDYLERADWIRRMLTREANPGLEAFNTHLLGLNATIAEVYSRPEDGYEDAIRNIVEQLSTALDCCAATLRFSDQQRGGEVTLQLFHACGCAARSDAAPQQQLTLDDHSIVVSAYRTRHVQRWSHGRRDGWLMFSRHSNLRGSATFNVRSAFRSD
ncbi:MAG: hypothetical protein IPK16_17220 [Anaerolineales bacterium]|nr:hypothetical protein [Anaerolineales bacterium]